FPQTYPAFRELAHGLIQLANELRVGGRRQLQSSIWAIISCSFCSSRSTRSCVKSLHRLANRTSRRSVSPRSSREKQASTAAVGPESRSLRHGRSCSSCCKVHSAVGGSPERLITRRSISVALSATAFSSASPRIASEIITSLTASPFWV